MSFEITTPVSLNSLKNFSNKKKSIVIKSNEQFRGKILLGRYRLNSLIAQGGMGSVYLARNIEEGGLYAIKVLRDELILVPQVRERFLNESRAAQLISHPAIVQTIEIGEMVTGAFFIVMEYVNGSPLRRLIRQNNLSYDRTIIIVSAIAEGLAAAHEKGVIHRDLKPENILIPRNGLQKSVAKIVDFGIARIMDTPQITTTQNVLGTPQYISPEQAMGAPVDARADIYALGVIMYEMLSGTLPFIAKTPESFLLKHIKNKPKSLREHSKCNAINKQLEQLIMSCLEKTPNCRPSSMSDLITTLALL